MKQGLDFSSEGSREARAFALWLNSLGIDPYVNNLFEDLRDGLVLLRAEDAIEKGSVDWKQVKEGKVNNFQKIGNCKKKNFCLVSFVSRLYKPRPSCGGHWFEAAVQVLAGGHSGSRH